MESGGGCGDRVSDVTTGLVVGSYRRVFSSTQASERLSVRRWRVLARALGGIADRCDGSWEYCSAALLDVEASVSLVVRW